jgi:hypothetical protein
LSHTAVAQQPVPASQAPVSWQWPSEPPSGIPFPSSTKITGIVFTGTHAKYEHADTWYPSWANNGNLYSPYTDGKVNGIVSSSYSGKDATTGFATVVGNDPLHLEIKDAGTYPASSLPYGGRYPAGTLVYNGV